MFCRRAISTKITSFAEVIFRLFEFGGFGCPFAVAGVRDSSSFDFVFADFWWKIIFFVLEACRPFVAFGVAELARDF